MIGNKTLEILPVVTYFNHHKHAIRHDNPKVDMYASFLILSILCFGNMLAFVCIVRLTSISC